MDKPIPEAVRALAELVANLAHAGTCCGADDERCECGLFEAQHAATEVLTAAQQPDHIVDATKMVAQQQGQAVAWMTPEAIAHLAKQNGPAKVDAWNCASGADRVPVYTAPPSAPVGVEGFDKRFADMLLGVLSNVQDELGFTDEDKLCANGSAEIVAEIRELKRAAALAQQPAAVDGAWQVQLADALECFWNPAIEGSGDDRSNIIGGMVQGFAAVAYRLREHAAIATQHQEQKS